MSLEIRLAYDELDCVKELFAEFVEMLHDLESEIQRYLWSQEYDYEIDHLGEKYGLPNGRLYIAYVDNQAAGCVALRQLNKTECEMKRLYVRPAFRGSKIGRTLVGTIVRDAKEIGYQYMLLDTLPALESAIALYKDIGFYEIPPYNDSPADKTVFMKLDL